MVKLPHDTRLFTLSENGKTLCFSRPADLNAVLDSVLDSQYEKDKFLPYWAEHWPSAEALVEYLSQISIPRNSVICEIGCGLGVISAFLAAQGHTVTAFDLSFDSTLFTVHNHLQNGLTPRVVCCDWRDACFHRSFDICVASDVLYESRWINPVLDFVGETLKPGGQLIIADPKRSPWEDFKKEAQARHFQFSLAHTRSINHGKTHIEIGCIRPQ